ncbi:hypothetical protein Poli38472_000534 [Pythium oligandrum]|uniref:Uncharacterized protein n=1 Tax=Pythium oligandrum TaxID=41045 RepID=A0A8K1CDY4_PYTOL|nr:hypothetical protein Poli38472_000534 [Pythium oligandrum]|eukprot:TMW60492.1 hypothetical protein Poli38472_000534 [Pythium oligandrum]
MAIKLTRHVVVLMVAMVVAAYQMLKLEQQRTARGAMVDDQFDRAVHLLRKHLRGKRDDYKVLLTHPSDASTTSTALVVNRSPSIPRIEAELSVDPARVREMKAIKTQQPKTGSRPRQSKTPPVVVLRFHVYDTDTMASTVQILEQHGLIDGPSTQE